MRRSTFILLFFLIVWETAGRTLLRALFPDADLPGSVFTELANFILSMGE